MICAKNWKHFCKSWFETTALVYSIAVFLFSAINCERTHYDKELNQVVICGHWVFFFWATQYKTIFKNERQPGAKLDLLSLYTLYICHHSLIWVQPMIPPADWIMWFLLHSHIVISSTDLISNINILHDLCIVDHFPFLPESWSKCFYPAGGEHPIEFVHWKKLNSNAEQVSESMNLSFKSDFLLNEVFLLYVKTDGCNSCDSDS